MGRPRGVCENYGVAATGLFEYWHRITHDVLRPDAPDALVLCIYPGNDFIGEFPADGFEPTAALVESITGSRLGQARAHVVEPEFAIARFVQERIHSAFMRLEPPYGAPKLWWTDPVVTATHGDAPVVRRSRALAPGDRRGLPAVRDPPVRAGGRPRDDVSLLPWPSPLARILADWKIEAPVIDVAKDALAFPTSRDCCSARRAPE